MGRPAVRAPEGTRIDMRLHRCDHAMTGHTDSFTWPAEQVQT